MSIERPFSHQELRSTLSSLAIGSLSIGLILGLTFIGVIERFDASLMEFFLKNDELKLTQRLPIWIRWSYTIVSAYALAWSVIQVGQGWRQWLLIGSSAIIVAGWGPILILASTHPQVSGTLTATIWSGLCAIIYSRKPDEPIVANISASNSEKS